jgi:multicomponent Na+:H+ antiporter subunit C
VSPNLLFVIVVGVLFAAGVALLLERTLTRVILGLTLLSNGANLLILLGGGYGGPPIVGVTAESRMSDPLAQAMVLTAIVITLGMTAFLLAMAYRSWVLTGHDEVQDDVEDRRIMARAEHDEGPETEDEQPDEDTITVPPGAADGGHGGPR